MTNPNFLFDSFTQRRVGYEARLQFCRTEFSEAAVHDLRVSVRRLLSTLEIIQVFDRHPFVRKLCRSLKDQLDGFDDLRDTQVMLANIARNIDDLPALLPFKETLEKRETRLLKAAQKRVSELELKAFNRRMNRLQATLMALAGSDPAARLLKEVDRIYGDVRRRYDRIDPKRPASIHRLRIAYKKFRYTIEAVQPILADFPEAQFKRMHDYQDLMGNIQDAEVFSLALKKYARRHPDLDLRQARDWSEQNFSRVLSIYLTARGELDTFWRTSPAAGFPWIGREKTENK